MTEKLHEYIGFTGLLHSIRDDWRAKWEHWKESCDLRNLTGCFGSKQQGFEREGVVCEEFSHIYRYVWCSLIIVEVFAKEKRKCYAVNSYERTYYLFVPLIL